MVVVVKLEEFDAREPDVDKPCSFQQTGWQQPGGNSTLFRIEHFSAARAGCCGWFFGKDVPRDGFFACPQQFLVLRSPSSLMADFFCRPSPALAMFYLTILFRSWERSSARTFFSAHVLHASSVVYMRWIVLGMRSETSEQGSGRLTRSHLMHNSTRITWILYTIVTRYVSAVNRCSYSIMFEDHHRYHANHVEA